MRDESHGPCRRPGGRYSRKTVSPGRPVLDLRDNLQAALKTRYTIEREIGHGGMAVVYQAWDLRHDRSVALKVLQPSFSAQLGAERFLQEIRVAARLRHPHLLPLYDSGDAAGLLYYVMPCIDDGSLRDLLRREGRLASAQALRIAREVADALDYAHRQGLIHRACKRMEEARSGIVPFLGDPAWTWYRESEWFRDLLRRSGVR